MEETVAAATVTVERALVVAGALLLVEARPEPLPARPVSATAAKRATLQGLAERLEPEAPWDRAEALAALRALVALQALAVGLQGLVVAARGPVAVRVLAVALVSAE
jgi:hypothetical protein